MTTIAYRDGVLAADRLITADGIRCGTVAKVIRGPGGQLAAVSGDLNDVTLFFKWVQRGCRGRPPKGTNNPLGYLVLPSGLVKEWEGTDDFNVFESSFRAAGSGERFAIGAMAAGADAVRAVEIACEFDVHSGGGIDVFRLKEGKAK